MNDYKMYGYKILVIFLYFCIALFCAAFLFRCSEFNGPTHFKYEDYDFSTRGKLYEVEFEAIDSSLREEEDEDE